MNMKLKIKIIGPKVHDVGYRVFLLKHAMNLALPGLSPTIGKRTDNKR
jgi:acylphosphatase